MTNTLASFHQRAPRAVSASPHNAALIPFTLFAAIDDPVNTFFHHWQPRSSLLHLLYRILLNAATQIVHRPRSIVGFSLPPFHSSSSRPDSPVFGDPVSESQGRRSCSLLFRDFEYKCNVQKHLE
jgi:hypothetical protein